MQKRPDEFPRGVECVRLGVLAGWDQARKDESVLESGGLVFIPAHVRKRAEVLILRGV